MNSICGRGFKGQMRKGFTLVELAIVLVIVGIILLAVLKGTDAINKARAERAVADLRGLQAMILEYQKRVGRLPGDCNNDGIIGFLPALGINGVAPDSTEANRILPSPAVDFAGDPLTGNCATSAASELGINILWNDMRRNNIVDPQRLPAELAKNSNGSFYAVGNMVDAAGNVANVIVVYDIPIWMAEAIDVAIDGTVAYTGTAAGTAGGAPNSGRIRRWDGNVTGAADTFAPLLTYVNGFAKVAETRDSLISISFQFGANKLPN